MRVKLLAILTASMLAVAGCASDEPPTEPTAPVVTNGGGAYPPGSVQQFTQEVGDRVLFGFDRFDLTPQARATLDRQAAWLQQYSAVTVQIEGHADERGTRAYNLALGERRANAVRNYLVALGVSPTRITTISYGKERPAVSGSNESAWSQNRRGVTVITAGATS